MVAMFHRGDYSSLQAAIDAAEAAINPAHGCVVVLEPGVYDEFGAEVNSTMVSIAGAGSNCTKVRINSNGSETVGVRFNGGSGGISRNAISGICFASKAGSTGDHVAIEAVNTTGLRISDIATTAFATTGTTIGYRARGRDYATIHRFWSAADIPIHIAKNPHRPFNQIQNDHSHFQDLYLNGNGTADPLVLVDPDVLLQSMTFDGAQAWFGGSHGFYWNADQSGLTSQSVGLSFANVRTENGDPNGWSFYIHAESRLLNLNFSNCYLDDNQGGVYGRNVYAESAGILTAGHLGEFLHMGPGSGVRLNMGAS